MHRQVCAAPEFSTRRCKSEIDQIAQNKDAMTNLSAPDMPGLIPDRLERVYQFLGNAVETGRLPSAAILIARQGIQLPVRTFGKQYLTPDSPPIQPETIFLTASVTKPVTVTAAMLLVERGKLLLDDPVASIIPEFAARDKGRVTLRHLMTHTSGLPDMLPEDRQLRAQHAPLEEFIRRICNTPLLFPPGTNIHYQSCGTAMLGAIVERIEGLSLRDFLRREIFDPLGMKDTALGAQGLDATRIPHVNVDEEMRGATWGWNTPYWHHFGAPWGGMFSTVSDIARFCQMFLNGGILDDVRVLSPATVQAMTADQTVHMPHIPLSVRTIQSWGLGWRRQPPGEWSFWGNLLSPGSFGHGGATGTVVWADPQRQLVCALFTTQPSAMSEGLLGRCSNLVAAAAI
jgi:CubicO group peptidase (beta-lactamase class C family)